MCRLVAGNAGAIPVLRTPRLLLRDWRQEDLAPFAGLNADPEVMRHFPTVLTGAESDALVTRFQERLCSDGHGIWAVEVATPDDGGFIGFVGLNSPGFRAAFTPCTEIGWRLARHAWGFGYATEAAQAAIGFAFGHLRLAELVSFTFVGNERSRAVMHRLGMRRDPAGDFDHPDLPPGHRLRQHVLYRLSPPDC